MFSSILQRAGLLLLVLSPAQRLVAQCATPQQGHRTHVSTLPIMERGGGPVLIPVIVHVYYTDLLLPNTTTRIAQAIDSCNAYMRALNAELGAVHPAFEGLVADAGVELRLATIDENGDCFSGILYHTWDQMDENQMAAHEQNTNRYLNIHVMPATNSYAQFPSAPQPDPGIPGDGILFSTYDAHFRLNVLAHELGHYLGLPHTFGYTNTSGEVCGDDGVADTPVTKGSVVGTCDQELSVCTDGVIENVDNLMDYSTCGKMFTTGQASVIAGVLDDPALNRYNLHQPANLEATGALVDPVCPIDAFVWHRVFLGCDSSRAEFFALAEGRVPETLLWSFPDGYPANSTADRVDVYYTQPGSHTAQLIACANGSCDTVNYSFTINVGDGMANGLPLVTSSPFTEDFEDGFTLPQTHMFAVDDSSPTWQPCDFAGHASANSLYIPAEAFMVADTCDLVLGNFDLSDLAAATVSFKVATAQYTLSSWSTLQLHFRDLCSNIFQGNPWAVWQLYEMSNGNNTADFIPTADEQWTTLSITRPEWHMASHAEFTLRLIRPATPPSQTPEAFYLDDVNVGDLSVGIAEPYGDPAIRVLPNPAHDRVVIQRNGAEAAILIIHDLSGRTMVRQRTTATNETLDIGGWPSGSYVVSLHTQSGVQRTRLVVE